MVRRHGWQLPAHTYQVVAITVFFLLSTAYYVFLAPFLGNTDLEYAAIGVYSFVALAVFLLYVRCTAIDPADPGILASSWKFVSKEEKGPLADSFNSALPANSLAASASGRSSSLAHFDKNPIQFSDEVLEKSNHRSLCYVFLGCMLGWFVKSDNCKPDRSDQQAGNDEDVLFCTLCNVEVRKYSKHCRSCDKCVDGFDHHCRWLNNCVGRKNYITFVSLMATCLMMLILDWGIGLAVLVRCFVNKKGIEAQIVEKLGNGFSRPPFIVVTVICTIVPLLASIPLGELFFFHIILIRKGITTYEYVVAMRAQNEPLGIPEIEQQSLPSSPTSSTATGLSGSSSVGLQYRGTWCTPPRVFVDHQEDEVVPHLGPGRVPSTVDPDATASGSRGDPRANKRAVRISAWKLAKLDRTEAVRAASKARESSSVLRPLGSRDVGASETGYSSSSNASVRSSVSADYGLAWGSRIRQGFVSPRTAYPPSQVTSKDDAETGGISASSLSSPGVTTGNTSTALSPLPLEMRFGSAAVSSSRATVHNQPRRVLPAMGMGTRHSLPIYHGTALSPSPVGNPSWIGTTPGSDGCEISSGTESVDERRRSNSVTADVDSRPLSNFGGSIRENRSTVYWDRTAGRFISVPNRSHLMRISNPFSRQQQPVMPNNNLHAPFTTDAAEAENSQSHCSPDNISCVQRGSPEPSSLVSPENLTYSGTSIFFGGPLSVPLSGNARKNLPLANPASSEVRPTNPPIAGNVLQENAGMRIPAARSQSPVFVPQRAQQNSSLPR